MLWLPAKHGACFCGIGNEVRRIARTPALHIERDLSPG
jgi:hypothetical protein